MIDFNKTDILAFLDKATDVIKSAAPLATMLGVPFVEKIAGWADTAVEVAQNALQRAEEGKVVLNSDDIADINARIEALHSVNNELAEYIANS